MNQLEIDTDSEDDSFAGDESTPQVDIFHEPIDKDVVLAVGVEFMDDSVVEHSHLWIENEVTKILLPSSLSQSNISGRNRTSSFTVIELVTRHVLTKHKILERGFRLNDILPLFLGSVELGNIYHPHGNFLSAAEGIDLLSNKMSVTLHNEKNCYITGESSLQDVFREYFNELHGIYFLMIVTSGMSFCVVKNGDFIFLFDSHSHGDMGAAIHSAKLDYMDNFIDEFPAPKNDLMYTCVVAVE